MWDARRKLLEDLPRMASELMEVAGAAAGRLQRPKDAGKAPPNQQRPSGDSSKQTGPKRPPAPPPTEKARPEQTPSELAGVEKAKLQRATERKTGSISSTRT